MLRKEVRCHQVIIAYHLTTSGEIAIDGTEIAAFIRVVLDQLIPWEFGTGPAVRDFLAQRGGPLALSDTSEDMAIEDDIRQPVLHRLVVVAGGYNADQLERRHDEQSLSAKAEAGHPGDLASFDQ